jgi:glycosyltransferase involved in cell wall biosynthesis
MTSDVAENPKLFRSHMPRLAVEQFDDSGWTGGAMYHQNLLKALASMDTAQKPYTILTRRPGEEPYAAEADQFLEIPLEPEVGRVRRIHNRIAKKLGVNLQSVTVLKLYMAAEKVDVLFTHKIYPPSFNIPLIGWIPDFQYMHLPEVNGVEHSARIAQYHRDLIEQSSAMLVSSNDVLKDLAEFSPQAARTAHVVRFVAYIPDEIYDIDPAAMCRKYSIPQRYFYLPNQFWKHKNHLLVVKALQILASRSVDATVVCTGTTHDPRNPNFFTSLLTEVAMAGLHGRFRILGLVDRQDVYHLQRQSLALLQPSLFEGWSTSIEEAKSLGKRVIASDLAVNIEQIPDADFFARHDAESLANCMQAVVKNANPGPDLPREEIARKEFPCRFNKFAQQFVAVIQQARSAYG